MFPKEQAQLFCHIINKQSFYPGIGTAGSIQRCLPTHQRGQTPKGIHQPVSQHIASQLT